MGQWVMYSLNPYILANVSFTLNVYVGCLSCVAFSPSRLDVTFFYSSITNEKFNVNLILSGNL